MTTDSSRRGLRGLLPYLAAHRSRTLLLLLTLLVQTVAHLATPFYYRLIFNAPSGQSHRFLLLLALSFLAVIGVSALTEAAQVGLAATLSTSVVNRMREDLFAHLQRLPLAFYRVAQGGDLLARFTSDLSAVQVALSSALFRVALHALVSVFSLGVLFLLEWRLATLAVISLGLVALVPRALGPRATEASRLRSEAEASATSMISETLAGQKQVRALGLEAHFASKLRGHLDGLQRAGVRATVLAGAVENAANLSVLAAQLGILGAGAVMVSRGEMTTGDLAGFGGFLLNIGAAVGVMSAVFPQVFQASGAMARINEVLDTPAAPDPARGEPAARRASEIRFEDVSFSHTPGAAPSVRQLTFGIHAGECVAVVGRSGSGKSTVLDLLARFTEPSGGAILWEGKDTRELSTASLRARTGMVLQDSMLFRGTVRENLRLGRQEASDAEIEEAARAAGIHDFVAGLPEGYQTEVGERGTRFSGGQRQRLALARALVRSPDLLLLDEATSALDPSTEAEILETLSALAGRVTIVSVTHRLAAAASADRILVLDAGVLAEHGDHRTLLARAGLYHSLWERQSGFALDADGTTARISGARLQAIPLFAGMELAALEELAGRVSSRSFVPGEAIVREGEKGDAFYVLARGRLSVSERGAQVRVLEDGDWFGEIALLADLPRTATVAATEKSVVLRLGRKDFDELLSRAPGIRASVERLARELGFLSQAAG